MVFFFLGFWMFFLGDELQIGLTHSHQSSEEQFSTFMSFFLDFEQLSEIIRGAVENWFVKHKLRQKGGVYLYVDVNQSGKLRPRKRSTSNETYYWCFSEVPWLAGFGFSGIFDDWALHEQKKKILIIPTSKQKQKPPTTYRPEFHSNSNLFGANVLSLGCFLPWHPEAWKF